MAAAVAELLQRLNPSKVSLFQIGVLSLPRLKSNRFFSFYGICKPV